MKQKEVPEIDDVEEIISKILEEVGKSAFSILTGKLEGGDDKSSNKIVRTNLVVRGTTK